MSIEIKFRAWNHEQMVSPDYIDRKGNAHWKENSIPTMCRPEFRMEFTGLQDKNGKEIYEGDIVEFVGGTCDCLTDSYAKHGKGTILVVKKLASGFSLCPKALTNSESPNTSGLVGNYSFWNHQRSLVIIGNIHENPELLNPTP